MANAFREADTMVYRNSVTFVTGFNVIADEPFTIGSPTSQSSQLITYNPIYPYGGVSGVVMLTGDQAITGSKNFNSNFMVDSAYGKSEINNHRIYGSNLIAGTEDAAQLVVKAFNDQWKHYSSVHADAPWRMKIANNKLFVASYGGGLSILDIFDISNPKNITLDSKTPSHFATTGGINGSMSSLELNGNYLYLFGANTPFLEVWDVTNTKTPAFVRTSFLSYTPNFSVVNGNYMFLTTPSVNGPVVFNISTGSNPVPVFTGSVPSTYSIVNSGNYLYTVSNVASPKLYVINAASPSSSLPVVFSGTVPNISNGSFITRYLSNLFIFGSNSWLEVYDITNPVSPNNINSLQTTATVDNGQDIFAGLDKNGSPILGLVGNGDGISNGGVEIYNIANIGSMYLAGAYNTIDNTINNATDPPMCAAMDHDGFVYIGSEFGNTLKSFQINVSGLTTQLNPIQKWNNENNLTVASVGIDGTVNSRWLANPNGTFLIGDSGFSSYLNAFGNGLGIGTVSPQYALDVNGDIGNSTTTSYFIAKDLYPSYFNALGGNVGFGTNAPSYTVDVNGSGNFTSGLRVSRNLGIGTGQPLSPLHVVGDLRLDGTGTIKLLTNHVNNNLGIVNGIGGNASVNCYQFYAGGYNADQVMNTFGIVMSSANSLYWRSGVGAAGDTYLNRSGVNTLRLSSNGTTGSAHLVVNGTGNFNDITISGINIASTYVSTGQLGRQWSSLTFATTTVWNANPTAIEDRKILTLTGNTTLAISGLYNGWCGTLETIQSGSGFNVTLPSGTKVANNGSGTILLSTGVSGAIDMISFAYNGTNLFANIANRWT